jgi:hypothetical protein
MTKNLILLISSFLISAPAFAQEYAAVVGVHQTDADTDAAGASIDGVMNFKAGLGVRFSLMEGSYFRTGVLYNQRHIESKASATGTKTKINFDYIDIPATYQYNINEMFGVFGGLVVGVNINDDVDTTPSTDPNADKIIPLLTAGVTLMFEDMIGFDFYYERGMGGFADNLSDYSSFGANFNYWF